MNYAVRTERVKTEKYVESAARGMPNCKLTNYETVLSTTDFDKVVFMGVLRGTHLVYKHAQNNKKDFYYIDRPYWGESRATPYWMRCVKNEHVKTFVDHDWRLSYYAGETWGELYDLRDDPGEIVNLWSSPDHQTVRLELMERMLKNIVHYEARTPLQVMAG